MSRGADLTMRSLGTAAGFLLASALAVALFGRVITVASAEDGVSIPPSTSIARGTAASSTPDAVPAKELFGAAKTPASMEARALGFYSKGCLAGALALPMNGPEWQVMRLSRNRNWGHPTLISYLERFAADVRRLDRWPGLLMGDLSQPRGGPMVSGHASHQVGLDADIWYLPMPNRRLTAKEREDLSANNLLGAGTFHVDPKIWTQDHVRLLKRAASYGEVERVFVHPGVKKALCEASQVETDKSWLAKIRPLWGHADHFHVRLKCPEGSVGCQRQPAPPADDGCGKELTDWFALLANPPKPSVFEPPPKPLTLDKLPVDCRTVLSAAPAPKATAAPAAKQ